MTFVALAIGTAVSVTGSIIAGRKTKNQEEAAERQRSKYQSKLEQKERDRQEITNPYENIKNLSSMINNPYANLQVSTQAAEMQAEEADLSLASSLDTLRSTGASAGGATALAQAALRSKQGVAASIGQQESQNARMRAQGQSQMNQQLMSEAQRMQQADVSGRQFMFGATETRQVAELDRLASLAGNAEQQRNEYGMQRSQILGSALGQVGGSIAGAAGDPSKPFWQKNAGTSSAYDFTKVNFDKLKVPDYGG
tara:strand:- start:10901 stop:11662 length:762 start_codon:yes stop_codon:yes gene_type:complete